MKKILITLLLIFSFAGFVWYQEVKTTAVNPQPVVVPAGAPPVPTPVLTPPATNATFRDGSYTGSVADAFYGLVQVQATIKGGKITDVQFLQYPNDRARSASISGMAMPILTQEAIQAQSANVDIVSGATQTSGAFQESLASALAQAQG